MKFSVADLLDQLSYDQPISQPTLAKILKLTNKADKGGLDLALIALGKLGVVSSAGETVWCVSAARSSSMLGCVAAQEFLFRHPG